MSVSMLSNNGSVDLLNLDFVVSLDNAQIREVGYVNSYPGPLHLSGR